MKDKAYYESLDKRTSEYKEWKANYDNSPLGLGDTVEKIAKSTGIDKAVKKLFGDDCGCKERKQKLNELIRYKPVNCFTEEQYIQWSEFRKKENKNILTVEDQEFVIGIMEKLFARTMKPCSSCGGRIKGFIEAIDNFYNTYQK